VRLLAVTGPRAGVAYELPEGEHGVGRSSSAAIQLVDEAVSRHHAVFTARGGALEVQDLGSQNGTLVNGVRLSGARRLAKADVVTVGATTFVLDPAVDYLLGPVDVILAGGAGPASTAATRVRGDEASPEAEAEAARVLLGLADAAGEAAELVGPALARVAACFSAHRGFVARVDAPGARPKVVASFGPGPITVSRTVVQEVLTGPTALVSEDATADTLLASGVSLAAGGIRALVAAPLVHGGRVLGLVHLDRPERGGFQAADLQRLLPHARVLALALLAQDGLQARVTRARARHRVAPPEIVAEAPAMRRLVEEARRAARGRAAALITGPTGAGKEVLAQLLHTAGDRPEGPFVALNCGALPAELQEAELFGHTRGAFTGAERERAGLVEEADGGTLFLDEVGEMAPRTQVALLRVLQEGVVRRLGETRLRPVEVRVVAATHRDLEAMVAEGAFREDLYFRLAVLRLRVPALAERPEDVVPLARRFAAQVARGAGVPARPLSPELEAALAGYGWPGNVRELRNLMERLVILAEGPTLGVEDLPVELWTGVEAVRRAAGAGDSLAEAVARLERGLIVRAMARAGGVKSAAAEALGISRVTLDAKLKLHAIPWQRTKRDPDDSEI
jgi:DNA-binding NtrC family response regulator